MIQKNLGFIAPTLTRVYNIHFSERIIETSDNSVAQKTAGEIRGITS